MTETEQRKFKVKECMNHESVIHSVLLDYRTLSNEFVWMYFGVEKYSNNG